MKEHEKQKGDRAREKEEKKCVYVVATEKKINVTFVRIPFIWYY